MKTDHLDKDVQKYEGDMKVWFLKGGIGTFCHGFEYFLETMS